MWIVEVVKVICGTVIVLTVLSYVFGGNQK